MKPERSLCRTLLLLSVLAITILMSCQKTDNAPDDPIIGNWKLKVVVTNGQTIDVSNRECFKDSYLRVTQKEMTISTSAPKETGGGCEKAEGTSKWENVNGKYWEVSGSDRTLLNITLLEDNEVLRLITSDSNTGNEVQMLYSK